MTLDDDKWLEIGTIVAPQGLDGLVRVYPSSDFPERFIEPGQRWLLRPGETQPEPIELLDGRYIQGKGIYVVELAGIEIREQAEALRNSILLVPKTARIGLEEDEFHLEDLIGLAVFDQLSGADLGIVTEIISAGNDLLVVKKINAPEATEENSKKSKKKTSDLLIPFVKEIVPIVDLPNRRLEINPPPGLLALG